MRPARAISMMLVVQLPPTKVWMPRSRSRSITSRFTGSRMMQALGSWRRVDAESIQYPFQPEARSLSYTEVVYPPPWQVTMMSISFSRSRFPASRRTPQSVPAKSGAFCPAWEVEKKCDSKPTKSCSSTMRFISTEPTIPRQPIKPIFFML